MLELIGWHPSLVANVGAKHYGNLPRTNAEGRITLTSLIPGALYRISDRDPNEGAQLRREFTVKPGETIDLGDILIAKAVGMGRARFLTRSEKIRST